MTCDASPYPLARNRYLDSTFDRWRHGGVDQLIEHFCHSAQTYKPAERAFAMTVRNETPFALESANYKIVLKDPSKTLD